MVKPRITWDVRGEEEVSGIFDEWASRLRDARPAFNDMANVMLEEQRKWWRYHGKYGGGSGWAPRKEPYRSWMKRNYPQRPILRGPDRKGHKGLQLRNQLTRRPFGIEKITSESMTIGTDLPYAKYHQEGTGRFPKRQPLKPLDPRTEARLTEILQGYLFRESVARSRAKYSNPLAKGGRRNRRRR